MVKARQLKLDEQAREIPVTSGILGRAPALGDESPQDRGQGDQDEQDDGQLDRRKEFPERTHVLVLCPAARAAKTLSIFSDFDSFRNLRPRRRSLNLFGERTYNPLGKNSRSRLSDGRWTMTILFMEPLSRAWGRMKIALFRPFDIHKWFVVGFNAFLAGLMDASGGSGGSRVQKGGSLGEFIHFPRTGWDR